MVFDLVDGFGDLVGVGDVGFGDFGYGDVVDEFGCVC